MDDQTNRARETSTRFALGIDVNKETLALALLTDADQLHTKTVRNTTAGFKALLVWIKRLSNQAGTEQVHACLEASGGYEEEAALFLQ